MRIMRAFPGLTLTDLLSNNRTFRLASQVLEEERAAIVRDLEQQAEAIDNEHRIEAARWRLGGD